MKIIISYTKMMGTRGDQIISKPSAAKVMHKRKKNLKNKTTL